MNNNELKEFLFKARLQTYTGSGGKVASALPGSDQLEFIEGDWKYIDIYFTGSHTFDGIETIYHQSKPVFGMSYFGDWTTMTEEETDKILRGALVANPDTRAIKDIEWFKDGYTYRCEVETDTINQVSGTETIEKDGQQVYYFYFAGGVL